MGPMAKRPGSPGFLSQPYDSFFQDSTVSVNVQIDYDGDEFQIDQKRCAMKRASLLKFRIRYDKSICDICNKRSGDVRTGE